MITLNNLVPLIVPLSTCPRCHEKTMYLVALEKGLQFKLRCSKCDGEVDVVVCLSWLGEKLESSDAGRQCRPPASTVSPPPITKVPPSRLARGDGDPDGS